MMTLDKDVEFKTLIAPEEISQKVIGVAREIDETYEGRRLTVLMIMKGAICFVADLIREITTDFELETMRCRSYGANGSERGDLTMMGLDDLDLKGRDVLVVDDICDSGYTLQAVKQAVLEKEAASVKTVVLLHRQNEEARKIHNPDFALFPIAHDDFVVGYGLDYKERYRGLPGISVIL